MNFRFLIYLIFAINFAALSQEKGKIINAPKIPHKNNTPNSPNTEKSKPKQELDFIFEDEPKLKFSNQYESNQNTSNTAVSKDLIRIEPLKKINSIVSDDTSSIDEGELMVVEIEERAQYKNSEVTSNVASYFDIWDTNSLNPYGVNPGHFDEVIPIKLYNESEGRNWAPVLDKTVLTSHFGWRWRRWHKGTDLDVETGDPVYAPFDGVVRIAGIHAGYGRTLVLRHYNGLETLYGHLSKINVEPNEIVKAGQEVAKGGNTGRSSGSHLHFETRWAGNQFDPENIYNFKVNPMQIKNQEFILSSRMYDYLRGGASKVITTSTNVDENASNIDEEEEEEEEVPVKVERRVWYKVNHGDSLIEISRKFHTSVQEICKMNNINPRRKLFVGLKLRVK